MTARLLLGDCLQLMKGMPSESFDSIVTDAPYGMSDPPDIAEVLRHWMAGEKYEHGKPGFMSATWDSFVPGPQVWTEALRVAKPGAHALVFASTRTVDLMGIACRLAGWEVRDTLHWLHYQGQPHGLDVSQAIDKMRYDRAEVLQVTAWIAMARDAASVTNRAIDAAFGTNGMAGHWTSQKSQPMVPTLEQVPRLLEVLGNPEVPADIRRLLLDMNGLSGAPAAAWFAREVVGQGYRVRKAGGTTPNAGISTGAYDLTTAATEDAAKWEGWNTALKPAIEPILLLRKPLAESSIARQVLATGTGAINIDGCRIPQGSKVWPGPQEKEAQTHSRNVDSPIFGDYGTQTTHTTDGQKLGRYPANLLHFRKPSRKEKEAGCEGLPMHYSTKGMAAGERGGLVLQCPEHGESFNERNAYHCGCAKVFDKAIPHNQKGRRNHHPTVKPIALMRYLCRLVTPPGGDILDMFGGSGTTGIGASLGGFDVTLCELDPAFIDIARARIKYAVPGQQIEGGTDPEPIGPQVSMFG